MTAAGRLLSEVVREWDLQVDGPVDEGRRPAVPVVTAEGVAALLEHAPAGSAYEHLALRAWDGGGAVRLLRADPRRHLLLTERAGADLRDRDAYDACAIVGSLYAVLHRAPLPQPDRLADLAPGWLATLGHSAVAAALPRRFADQVRAWVPGLIDETAVEPVLLHGDLRPETVRSGADGHWLATAPRPVTGDPAYEVAAVLRPWAGAAASGDLRGEVLDRFSAVLDAAGLEEDRARAWVVVRTLVELAADMAGGRATAEDVTWATTVVKAVQR